MVGGTTVVGGTVVVGTVGGGTIVVPGGTPVSEPPGAKPRLARRPMRYAPITPPTQTMESAPMTTRRIAAVRANDRPRGRGSVVGVEGATCIGGGSTAGANPCAPAGAVTVCAKASAPTDGGGRWTCAAGGGAMPRSTSGRAALVSVTAPPSGNGVKPPAWVICGAATTRGTDETTGAVGGGATGAAAGARGGAKPLGSGRSIGGGAPRSAAGRGLVVICGDAGGAMGAAAGALAGAAAGSAPSVATMSSTAASGSSGGSERDGTSGRPSRKTAGRSGSSSSPKSAEGRPSSRSWTTGVFGVASAGVAITGVTFATAGAAFAIVGAASTVGVGCVEIAAGVASGVGLSRSRDTTPGRSTTSGLSGCDGSPWMPCTVRA